MDLWIFVCLRSLQTSTAEQRKCHFSNAKKAFNFYNNFQNQILCIISFSIRCKVVCIFCVCLLYEHAQFQMKVLWSKQVSGKCTRPWGACMAHAWARESTLFAIHISVCEFQGKKITVLQSKFSVNAGKKDITEHYVNKTICYSHSTGFKINLQTYQGLTSCAIFVLFLFFFFFQFSAIKQVPVCLNTSSISGQIQCKYVRH